MTRASLIDLNPVRFNYFPGMISLDEWSGSRSAVKTLSPKNNVKIFNMITRIN